MAEAPRERPERFLVLARFDGHVRARPKPVFEAIARILDPGPNTRNAFLADAGRSLVVAQRGRWYRAEYRVVPDEKGSLVEHYLVHTRGRKKRSGKPVGRKLPATTSAEFDLLVRRLREELE